MDKTCIIITGATAVGKTKIAIDVARYFKTSIISADSRQCFRELNIGVAKPTEAELNSVPHYFINSHSISEMVSAATFESYAIEKANEIFKKNDVVIMTGGTGLYIKAFCEGLDPIPEADAGLRSEIILNYKLHGIEWLQEQVKNADPAYFSEGDTANPQRLMRALEIVQMTGRSVTDIRSKTAKQRGFNIIKAGLELPRETLYQRINHRVDEMILGGVD